MHDYIKILHICSAALLMTSMGYCYYHWKMWHRSMETVQSTHPIQKQTWLVIIPLLSIQLISGFTMMGLQHYDLSSIWISGSIIGFFILISSWFIFIYLLLSHHTQQQLQFFLLRISFLSLLSMIFLMANKI